MPGANEAARGSQKQVSRFQKPRYLAVPRELVAKAKDVTSGPGIGVMTATGVKKRFRSSFAADYQASEDARAPENEDDPPSLC